MTDVVVVLLTMVMIVVTGSVEGMGQGSGGDGAGIGVVSGYVGSVTGVDVNACGVAKIDVVLQLLVVVLIVML